MKTLVDFQKSKEFLVCLDSDGCVMDTMTSKHKKCFAPALISEWELDGWYDDIFDRWCEINLYSQTRGINRYRGLALILSEIDKKYKRIDGVDLLLDWVDRASELSMPSLKAEIAKNPSAAIFKKALNWSIRSNEAAAELERQDKLPFPNAAEAVEIAGHHADVAVVSSADPLALKEEWEESDMLRLTDLVLSQRDGKKADCLKALIKKGYSPSRVIMCGDSLGDLAASEAAGVFFFPIIIYKEEKSWEEFIFRGLPRLISDGFGGEYQRRIIEEFKESLNQKEKKHG